MTTGQITTLPVPSGHGSLDQYIHTVNSIPLLTPEEEHNLAERKMGGDVEAAKQLILSHLRVVVSIARGYDGYGLNQADLIQEGNIGLMKAVKRYEPDRGARLFSFAVHWIKAEIHEFILRNWRLVRVATTKPQRKLFFNLRSMRKSLSALSPKEAQAIADDLGVKLSEVLEMEQRMTGKDVALLADNSDDDDNFAPIDWLADHDNEPTRQSPLHPANRRPAKRTGQTRRPQPPHRRDTLAAGRRRADSARTGCRIRRFRRTHPPNRSQSHAKTAYLFGRRNRTVTPCTPHAGRLKTNIPPPIRPIVPHQT